MLPVRFKTVAVPLFIAASLAGQTAARFTVSGTVVNSVTNEPIRRALVAVGGSLVFSGDDGRFEVKDVPAGPAMISVQKPGYFDVPGDRKNVVAQSGRNEVLLKLVPESHIEGRIVDDDGEPLAGVNVQLLGDRIVDGTQELTFQGGAATDGRGHYAINGINAGMFVMRILPFPDQWVTATGESGRRVFAGRYYPNASDSSGAQRLEVAAGQTMQADFKLRSEPAFHIAGVIGPAIPSLGISLEDAEGQQLGIGMRLDLKTGKFLVWNVPNGTWTLHFGSGDEQGHVYAATETVAISSKSVDDVRVFLQPLATIPVEVTDAAGESLEAANLQLQLAQHNSSPKYFAMKQPEHPLELTNVEPGTYKAIVSIAGEQCIDSVTSGNLDLEREALTVEAGTQPKPIHVSVSKNCATLTVSTSLRNSNEKAAVLLLSPDLSGGPFIREVDGSASARFDDISPGDYIVYAFTNMEGLEYRNPEVMRTFQGQPITLSANENARLTLEVNERQDR